MACNFTLYAMLKREDDKSTAVVIGNPRSTDFEVVRTSLMPGLLKIVGHNKDHPKPIKIFEVGDVSLLALEIIVILLLYNSGFEVRI
uniref:Phenylalanyl tRNA synthetase beta chain core domain-containing protein n=1 Tax=Cucumis melo TaxID=3656 RepID=A0A1S3BX21_CUCME